MGVIYVKDFEPWAALGELAGQYFTSPFRGVTE